MTRMQLVSCVRLKSEFIGCLRSAYFRKCATWRCGFRRSALPNSFPLLPTSTKFARELLYGSRVDVVKSGLHELPIRRHLIWTKDSSCWRDIYQVWRKPCRLQCRWLSSCKARRYFQTWSLSGHQKIRVSFPHISCHCWISLNRNIIRLDGVIFRLCGLSRTKSGCSWPSFFSHLIFYDILIQTWPTLCSEGCQICRTIRWDCQRWDQAIISCGFLFAYSSRTTTYSVFHRLILACYSRSVPRLHCFWTTRREFVGSDWT